MQIVGLFLVKNEDLNIEWSISKVLDFCDKIIICDNYSTDNTWKMVKKIESENLKIEAYQVLHPRDSHKFIEKYAGTETWVFAVDGDEIYDAIGLKSLRDELLNGKYQEYFKLVGHCLHVEKLLSLDQVASGYLTPCCKSVTKLYNFNAINIWKNPPHERLHGGEIIYKNGYSDEKRYLFTKNSAWSNCSLRCLHLCFVKRSSEDISECARINVDENPSTYSSWFSNKVRMLLGKNGIPNGQSNWKLENYAKGEKVTVSIADFSNH